MMSSLVNPSIIISKVKDLCQRLEYFGIKVGDTRKRPQISPVTIFRSCLLIPILRLKSLNQLDLEGDFIVVIVSGRKEITNKRFQ